MADTDPSKDLTGNDHENSRFYGKSSVVVLSKQLVNERYKDTDGRSVPDRRKQFWVFPDVSLATVHTRSTTDSLPVDVSFTEAPFGAIRVSRC